jgi:hypothetical protein
VAEGVDDVDMGRRLADRPGAHLAIAGLVGHQLARPFAGDDSDAAARERVGHITIRPVDEQDRPGAAQ